MKINIFIISLLLLATSVFGQGLGVGFGPSFKSVDGLANSNWKTIQSDMNTGFNLNARIKFGEDDMMKYIVNAGWNKFTISQLTIANPLTPSEKYDLKLTQNIFPLSFGVQIGIPLENLLLYGTVDGVYNIIKNSLDYNRQLYPGFSFGTSIMFGETTTTRIGAALGIGAQLSLGAISLDLCIKLQYLNLLNKESNEESSSCVMTNISIFFGK